MNHSIMSQLIQYAFLWLLLPQTTRRSRSVMSYTQVPRGVDRCAKPPPEVRVEVFGKLWHNKRRQNPGSHPRWHPKFQDIQKHPQVSQQHFSFTLSHRGSIPSTQAQRAPAPGVPLPARTAVRDRQHPAELLGSAAPWNMFYLIQSRKKPYKK